MLTIEYIGKKRGRRIPYILYPRFQARRPVQTMRVRLKLTGDSGSPFTGSMTGPLDNAWRAAASSGIRSLNALGKLSDAVRSASWRATAKAARASRRTVQQRP